MDNEQTVNKSVNTKDNEQNNIQSSLADIVHVLRAHLLLIIIITLLFAAGGYLYSKTRTPVYTASVPVQFEVKINETDKASGKEIVDQVSSTNYLFAYLDTAVRFCASGEVLDRANVYFYFYKQSGKKLDDFIAELSDLYNDSKMHRGEIPGYLVDEELKEAYRGKWFNGSNVGTNYNSSESDTVVNFKLWVTDLNSTTAREKARIFALAADVALNRKVDFGTATAGIIELNNSSSGVSVAADVPTNRIIIIAAFIGFMISLALIYILYLLDNTVKAKEQLEKMTGASVVAYIDDVSEARNG